MSYVPNTKGVKIKTPNGYEDFDGIRKVIHPEYLKIEFADGSNVSCSLDHRIRATNGKIQWWEYAKNLNPAYMAVMNHFSQKAIRITKITLIKESVELFDIVNAGLDYCFLSNGIISHNCEFLGSANTLISTYAIENMPIMDHIFEYQGYMVFEPPEPDHSYIISVDVSRGKGLDNSAFSVIDITEYPMKQVASFYNSEISPLLYPSIIQKVGMDYNMAWVMVENNDIGGQVVSILNNDLEYENIVSPQTEKGKYEDGLRTTKRTKSIGCSVMRDLIDNQQLLIRDSRTKEEAVGFVVKGGSYGADEGYHDDLMMTLVNFAYLTTTEDFQNLSDTDVRSAIFAARMQEIEEDMCPFASIDDGIDDEDQSYFEPGLGMVESSSNYSGMWG